MGPARAALQTAEGHREGTYPGADCEPHMWGSICLEGDVVGGAVPQGLGAGASTREQAPRRRSAGFVFCSPFALYLTYGRSSVIVFRDGGLTRGFGVVEGFTGTRRGLLTRSEEEHCARVRACMCVCACGHGGRDGGGDDFLSRLPDTKLRLRMNQRTRAGARK